MPKKAKKGERWRRINKKIRSELEYLEEFELAVEESFNTAETLAARVAQKVAADLPDRQAEVRERVGLALLRAAPSEASDVARRVASEVLGTEVPAFNLGLEAESLIGGTVEARAEMYVDSVYATYENSVLAREADEGVTLGRRILEEGDNCDDCIAAATEEFVPLDTLPEIGDSQCQSRCRCEFEFLIGDESTRVSELFTGVIGGQDKYGGSETIN